MSSPPNSNDINAPENQAAAGAALALATTELEYRVELLNKWVCMGERSSVMWRAVCAMRSCTRPSASQSHTSYVIHVQDGVLVL